MAAAAVVESPPADLLNSGAPLTIVEPPCVVPAAPVRKQLQGEELWESLRAGIEEPWKCEKDYSSLTIFDWDD
eukprot:CAMPEP_0197668312 /NCGR_PEP_ID=MMETSP1338-20131121/68969_1 /TAXON_ID=43686 ORGANISM="Pelagodinium beii, Strain RCC1491" /NCGR_SAMPLE_ID=MMETSP1338 /ASSEMBLY_ACC=CAM_ASM_000754 /LENGTH=72 /DNA_ID=CAMNT_0043247711 /DNA_START=22 /DNA_END=237 /DNA_ORIENTATION=+